MDVAIISANITMVRRETDNNRSQVLLARHHLFPIIIIHNQPRPTIPPAVQLGCRANHHPVHTVFLRPSMFPHQGRSPWIEMGRLVAHPVVRSTTPSARPRNRVVVQLAFFPAPTASLASLLRNRHPPSALSVQHRPMAMITPKRQTRSSPKTASPCSLSRSSVSVRSRTVRALTRRRRRRWGVSGLRPRCHPRRLQQTRADRTRRDTRPA